MTQIKLHNRLDDSNGTVKNEPNNAMQSASPTKKSTWHLRFAPGAILRKSGLVAILSLATVLTQAPVEQAEAASLRPPKPKPKPTPTNPPGSGIGDSIAGNFIYDALTGQRVAVTSAMSGTITAVPSINEINSYRLFDTASDYTLNLRRLTTGVTRERNSQSRDGYSAGHKWTEYFDVDFDMVVDNPDYDPEAEPGEPNSERYKIEDGGGGGQSQRIRR